MVDNFVINDKYLVIEILVTTKYLSIVHLYMEVYVLPITITAITIVSYQSIINVTKVSGESVLVRQGVQ